MIYFELDNLYLPVEIVSDMISTAHENLLNLKFKLNFKIKGEIK